MNKNNYKPKKSTIHQMYNSCHITRKQYDTRNVPIEHIIMYEHNIILLDAKGLKKAEVRTFKGQLFARRKALFHTLKSLLNDGWINDRPHVELCNSHIANIHKIEKLIAKYKGQELIEGEKFAQKCDVTGEGMNAGWMIGDSYFKYQRDADNRARTMRNEENPKKGNYKNFKDLYNSMDEDNNDFCYWTEWEMPTDAQYIVRNGKLKEI